MPEDEGAVLLAGVGGQGVVLAGAVVADAARRAGYDVKQSEVHGMAQRGGVVSSHLRFGRAVRSPLIGAGEADAIVALEWNEALRALPHLRPGGALVLNLQRIVPPGAFRDRRGGVVEYPAVALAPLRRAVEDVRACDAAAIAARAGNAKAMNSVLLGVLAPLLPFDDETWRAALAASVPPRTVEANARAFEAGRALRYPQETVRLAATAAFSPDGAVVRRPRAVELEIVAAWCKGEECALCVRVCPEGCLAFGDPRVVSVTRPDACTGCRLCELYCPDFAIVVHAEAAAPAASAAS